LTCRDAQEFILENLDCSLPSDLRTAVEWHLLGCPECTAFQAKQLALDQALAGRYVAPPLSAAFRLELQSRITTEKRLAIWECLPDLLHLGGGLTTTVGCAYWVPASAAWVFTAGCLLTLGTYFAQTIFRSWLEDSDGL